MLSAFGLGGDEYEDVFACDRMSAISSALPLGTYNVVVSLWNLAGDQRLAQTMPISHTLTVDGELQSLGAFMLQIL